MAEPVTHQKAKALVEAEINRPDPMWPNRPRLVVLDELTIERPWGWVFFYETVRYLTTRADMDRLVGNAPYIVNRTDGSFRVTGTALPIEHYIEEHELELNTTREYPCPCCGYLVFAEPPGSDEICPICFWEDDVSQLRFVNMGGGANSASLSAAQRNFIQFGACEEKHKADVRVPTDSDSQDPEWRPLDLQKEIVEKPKRGVDYGSSYPADSTLLYYWRSNYWRRPAN